MLEGLAPDLAPRLMIAIGGVALAFVILIVVLIFLKRKNSPLFVKGGRGREHRLMVLDAAAIDAKRRLVLIRRDETEHLIMIGGPTDIVIETGINGVSRQPAIQQAVETVPERAIAPEIRAAIAAPVAKVAEAARPAQARQAANADVGQRPRHVERQQAREQVEPTIQPADAKGISAMGSMLYDEDREPFGGEPAPVIRPAQPAISAQPVVTPAEQPLAARAEDMLDQARERVLSTQSLAEEQKAAAEEAAVKAMAERLEAARIEGLRVEAAKIEAQRQEAQRAEAARQQAEREDAMRQQAAELEEDARQQAAQREEAERLQAQQQAAQRLEAERLERERAEARRIESARLRAEAEKRAHEEAAERRAQAEAAERRALADEAERRAEAERIAEAERERAEPTFNPAYAENLSDQRRDALASDFEKLLEVELQKGGILDDGTAPHVEIEPRDAAARNSVYPVPREPAHVVTGATPGLSVEQDMARRLGEITLNKKTDSL